MDGSSSGVQGMKFLQRPPRGNAVRDHHGLPNLKNVQFAEQVRLAYAKRMKTVVLGRRPARFARAGGEHLPVQAGSSYPAGWWMHTSASSHALPQ